MKKFYRSITLAFLSLNFCLWSLSCFSQEQLKSPSEFLGYELGTRFTPHHRVVDYFRHVADVVPNAKVEGYGQTYEMRPLIYAVISTADNIKNLEQIRTDNLKRAGVLQGKPASNPVAIVWLSYNVHGNEASSTEASMRMLYELVSAKSLASKWLHNTVVIIDPCLNPDGRDRYVNFYTQHGHLSPNPSGDSYEHHEPWPSGRPNHYMFDLNRDWAWATQIETQERLKIYNQWLPHVHVDFHEQGINSPYFFAPAAEPMHEVISPWQKEYQLMIGKNNAKYFDEKGWLYFTREYFDLYYPSYGDTYPTYNGAIGLTYEQAGGGYGGLSVTTATGDELTLLERIDHHFTTGLSTVEISSQHADRVVKEFEKYFSENINAPASAYKTYLIKGSNGKEKLHQLTRWLDRHDIRYGHPAAPKQTRGFGFLTQSTSSLNVEPTDLIISAHQPKSRFVTAIFEPSSKLPDSLTYDITAWNLMYAMNLNAYAIPERINLGKPYERDSVKLEIHEKPYAYIFPYHHITDVGLLSEMVQQGIKVRMTQKPMLVRNQTFMPGTLVVTRVNNEGVTEFDKRITTFAQKYKKVFYTTKTGMVDQGKDLGSSDLALIKAPKVAMLYGSQVSSLNAGELWYFFEQELQYPVTHLGTNYFNESNLFKYDILIIPEGDYSLFNDTSLEFISRWVSNGGRLIVIGNAVANFSERNNFTVKKYLTDDEKTEAAKREKQLKETQALARFADEERKYLSESILGAIYKVKLDNSHPLAFGLPDYYYTLKVHEQRYGFLQDGWNVGYLAGKAKPVQGFAGQKANDAMSNSLVFGVQPMGSGEVVYLVDNPLFRAFWENGKMIFSNAIFMPGN